MTHQQVASGSLEQAAHRVVEHQGKYQVFKPQGWRNMRQDFRPQEQQKTDNPSLVFQFPPPVPSLQPVQQEDQELSLSPFLFHLPPPTELTCVVEQEGHLRLHLRAGLTLDIAPNMAVRLSNPRQDTSLALSPCSSQLALLHPSGRLLQYGPRIEVQVEDQVSIKNVKIHPKGVSFTANNCALVYLLDEAGARSTSDMFHDLHASNIVDTLFEESLRRGGGERVVGEAIRMLEEAQYWREGEDCWRIGSLGVRQTRDGLVTVERDVGGARVLMKASPNNGKVRFECKEVVVTGSRGEEGHLFLRSGDRRLHYTGQVSGGSCVHFLQRFH